MIDLDAMRALADEAKAIGTEMEALFIRAANLWAAQPEMGMSLLEFIEKRVADLTTLTGKVN